MFLSLIPAMQLSWESLLWKLVAPWDCKKTTSGNHKYLDSKNLVSKLQILHIYEATSFQSQNLPLSFYEHEKLQMFWNQIDYVIILFFPQDIPVNESKMKVINFCLL